MLMKKYKINEEQIFLPGLLLKKAEGRYPVHEEEVMSPERISVDTIKKVFPDREIVDIDNADPIFHTIYDLDDRFQVPGAQYLWSGRTYEKDQNGRPDHWRAIYDDKGRIMVAICHNMDLGDSVEHYDNPMYPQKYSAEGVRIFLNYVIYSMTH